MTDPEQLRMEGIDSIPTGNDKQRLEKMHDLYGECSASCGTCSNFIRRTAGKRAYCKCLIYGDTHGAWTDWRAYWVGCGHINQPLKPGEHIVAEPLKRWGLAETIDSRRVTDPMPRAKRGRPRKEKNQ